MGSTSGDLTLLAVGATNASAGDGVSVEFEVGGSPVLSFMTSSLRYGLCRRWVGQRTGPFGSLAFYIIKAIKLQQYRYFNIIRTYAFAYLM
ncbi:hypothetical protein A3H09_03015 [Candidatus Falkowbacteria bacterium RIFCSPLOWO2_12_FULL_45_13]|uniref:Uncharacterized protein n=1 Tax=Candidatus Falkowbacteria bacterium RIFCSPLOWO2_12_FULL_45_13 TaxID=1797991 RepID=A0A1F5SUS1_9BACT|nr:MAG: hypothetical protein A3H09_03015 [Candidatus Falkowbacteria bacterium RIFCSPLOWO2_12_FULL_45_13]